ncbi:ATP-binding cassette domain-containing protein [Asanoa iriomotensis]|uniref:Multidrug ABC transporter permease n=1 Tax=Asanoa iriomotensis TaxID=234613 RepID=A0ABQ4C5V4_9ACTN|nr:ATP-binding cassette domain-containing protein [Asanoa iriomotensis]GIF58152.1 multidrug ABC transporter permease [Asanoa iriomotensis]
MVSAPTARRLPALRDGWWQIHHRSLVKARLATVLWRLPVIVARTAAMAWRASAWDTAAAAVLNLAAGAATAWALLATRAALQALLAEGATPDRLRAALPQLVAVAVAVAVRSGLTLGAGWALARLEPRVLTLAERRLFELTTSVDLAAYDDPRFCDELERARKGGAQSVQHLVRATVDLLAGSLGLVAAATALLILHPLLVLALMLASVPGFWAALRAARLSYLSIHARTSRRRRLWMLADLMALRETAAELRALTMRRYLLGEYVATAETEIAAELDVARRQAAARALGSVLSGAATLGVYAVIGALVGWHALPLAAAGAAVLAVQAARQSSTLAINTINRVYEEGLYFEDYTDFCVRARARVRTVTAVGTMRPPERISVRDAALRYPNTPAPALAGVTFTIRRGQTIALVGENGSGKTSLARLIAGLYQPDSGTVCWNDLPLGGFEPGQVWRHVGMVSQNYWHWPFTAEGNIRLGSDRTPDEAATHAAARAAGAHDMILALPAGYQTLLSRQFEGGMDLSGGQWQRLAMARALFRDAPLLICDEPSAALDARAEQALFAALRRDAARRITVLITHRLANIRHADRIYVLHNGQIVEQGTHAELSALGGRYAELFALQATGYRT